MDFLGFVRNNPYIWISLCVCSLILLIVAIVLIFTLKSDKPLGEPNVEIVREINETPLITPTPQPPVINVQRKESTTIINQKHELNLPGSTTDPIIQISDDTDVPSSQTDVS